MLQPLRRIRTETCEYTLKRGTVKGSFEVVKETATEYKVLLTCDLGTCNDYMRFLARKIDRAEL